MKRLIANFINPYKSDIDEIYENIYLNEYLDDKVILLHFEPYFFYPTLETPGESGIEIETDIRLSDSDINDIKLMLVDYLNNNEFDLDIEYTSIDELADKIIELYSPVEWYYENDYNIKWEDNYIDNYDPEGARADEEYDKWR